MVVRPASYSHVRLVLPVAIKVLDEDVVSRSNHCALGPGAALPVVREDDVRKDPRGRVSRDCTA